jgi:hypothetical protein
MNTYAVPPRTMRRSHSSSIGSSPVSPAKTHARPRRVADLLVIGGDPAAGSQASHAGGSRSSSHWVAVARDLHVGERPPAHVKALARELGVDATVAWDALDGTYR